MKSVTSLLSLLLLLSASALAQNGWGLVPGSSHGDEGNGIYLSYRLPGGTIRDPATGRNIGPNIFPLILGYSKTLNEAHILSAEAGWVQAPFLQVTDVNGVTMNIPANIPQVRGAYRFLPLGREHSIEPFVGGGIVLSSTLTNALGQRFVGINADLQVMAGIRVFPGGPLFLQLEVPYTLAIFRQLFFPNGGSATDFTLGSDFTSGQFWPLFGVGITW